MDRVIVACFAGSAIFAALLLVELGDTADQSTALPSTARTKVPAAPAAQRPRAEELVQTTLAQPLFSPTRRPPDQPTGDKSSEPQLPNLRLSGIVIEPEHRLAIFAVPGSKPLARAEGETINEWRLDSIGLNQVSLSGPTGITTLEPKSDPNLVRQKPVAQPAPKPTPSPPAVATAPAPPPGSPQPGKIAFPPGRPSAPVPTPARRANPTRPAG
jgi:hypothetical protein